MALKPEKEEVKSHVNETKIYALLLLLYLLGICPDKDVRICPDEDVTFSVGHAGILRWYGSSSLVNEQLLDE